VKVRASPQQRDLFAAQCVAADIKPLNLILDVKTRWNSTFDMLKRAVELRKVILIFLIIKLN
jgi:hypothetical protein